MHDHPVALVTGANKGIGLQIAKDLAGHGLTVLVGSRHLDNGELAAKDVGGNARTIQLDVTDQASVAAAAERIRSELGRLDVLVNNAGISHADTPGRSLEEVVAAGHLSVAPLDEVRYVLRIQGGSQCCHGCLRRRAGIRRHQGQRRMPWLHRHRPQLLPRHPHRRAGRP